MDTMSQYSSSSNRLRETVREIAHDPEMERSQAEMAVRIFEQPTLAAIYARKEVNILSSDLHAIL